MVCLGLPFATPSITAVQSVDGGTVSIERFLSGTPMKVLVSESEKTLPQFATDAIISVLSALRDNPVGDTDCFLPILGIEPSHAATTAGHSRILVEVAQSKVERYGNQLRRSVRDFDWVYEQTVRQVSHLADCE